MGMKAPVTGGGEPREVPPAGKYMGVCNAVYVIGTQPAFEAGSPPKLQVMLGFELHKRKGPALDSGGRVFETSKIMNFTANEKSTLIEYASALESRQYAEADLKAIKDAGGFDPETLLGKCCWLDVVNDKGKDKIKGVSALDPEDDKAPEGLLDEVYWDWTLGVECPRRIAFFWERALENPNRKGDAANAGLAVPPSQFAQIDPATVPF